MLEVGSCVLQVSQPRMPCVNVARRWNLQELPVAMEETGFTGFYCRVLTEGEIRPGDTVTVTHRPYPEWTLLRVNQQLYRSDARRDDIDALRAVPILTGEWKRALGRKLTRLADIAPS